MSLNLEQIHKWEFRGKGADRAYAEVPVTESEIIGLAVQLLLSKGAKVLDEDPQWGWSVAPNQPPRKGRFLVVPQVWAQEWCRIAREMQNDGVSLIDEGWMIGWFADAIENAKDHERRDQGDALVIRKDEARDRFVGHEET